MTSQDKKPPSGRLRADLENELRIWQVLERSRWEDVVEWRVHGSKVRISTAEMLWLDADERVRRIERSLLGLEQRAAETRRQADRLR